MPLDKGAVSGAPHPPEDAVRPGEDHRPADGAPGDGRIPGDPHTPSGAPGAPGVHDQLTVTSMPGVGTGPVPSNPFAAPQNGPGGPTGYPPPQAAGAGWSAPGTVPPPPVGPNGPGQAAPPMGPGGYPGGPFPPGAAYGYPAAQAPQFGYPGYPGYGNPWGGPQPANGMGIAALVLGIIATVGFCLYGLGVLLGVLALVFGIIGRGRAQRGEADNGGVALAGIILGSIGIVVGAAFLGFLIWAINSDYAEDDGESDSGQTSVSQVVEAREHAPHGHFAART
ncbi:DUF4190 domain-containing protein [Streptomyces sp. NBC_01420]|uniref:DUF4190 domain-containing protein n=1 Tax=Streptomyces sp. NBC_01420 TaxID=2903858 RepID=UPI003864F275